MKILNNLTDAQSHINELCDCLKTFKKAYISVAFLKMSGLNLIIDTLKIFLSKNGELNIIAGQNFGLTDPEALTKLLNLLKNYPSSKLYLYKAVSGDSIFHPKMYLFKTDERCKIILGSANMTKGGISSNNEISISFECKPNSDIWKQSKSTFDNYISNSTPVTLLAIAQYRHFYDEQRMYNIKINPVPPISRYAFNYTTLKRHIEKWTQTDLQDMSKKRRESYSTAVEKLNKIADEANLPLDKFILLLESVLKHWHSGGLQRKKTSIYGYHKNFVALVRFIRDNKSKCANEVFSTAKEIAKTIEGVGVNYITEIMISYNPKDFAVLNRNPFTVLTKEAGVTFRHAIHSFFNGEDYAEYCDLIKEISKEFGFSDMHEADIFFNKIYWEIRKYSA